MASGEAVLERMLRDCECVTVAILTQELRFVGLNSIQLVLDYARDKDNLQLIYSVSYTDEGGNLVLSHKTGQELEELRKYTKRWGRLYLEFVEQVLKMGGQSRRSAGGTSWSWWSANCRALWRRRHYTYQATLLCKPQT